MNGSFHCTKTNKNDSKISQWRLLLVKLLGVVNVVIKIVVECPAHGPKVAIKNKGLCQYMEHYSHFFGLPVSAFSTLVLSFEFYIIETKIFTTISVRIPRQACWTETGRPNK